LEEGHAISDRATWSGCHLPNGKSRMTMLIPSKRLVNRIRTPGTSHSALFQFSEAIHFTVVAYPGNEIFIVTPFVFCVEVLYSHGELSSVGLASDVLEADRGKVSRISLFSLIGVEKRS